MSLSSENKKALASGLNLINRTSGKNKVFLYSELGGGGSYQLTLKDKDNIFICKSAPISYSFRNQQQISDVFKDLNSKMDACFAKNNAIGYDTKWYDSPAHILDYYM